MKIIDPHLHLFDLQQGQYDWLKPENPDYPIIEITEDNNFIIWGIVTNVIKKV